MPTEGVDVDLGVDIDVTVDNLMWFRVCATVFGDFNVRPNNKVNVGSE